MLDHGQAARVRRLDRDGRRDGRTEHEGSVPGSQLGFDVRGDLGPGDLGQQQARQAERRVVRFPDLGDDPFHLGQADDGIDAGIEGHDDLFGERQGVDQERRRRRPGVEDDERIAVVEAVEAGPQPGVPPQLLRERHVDPAQTCVGRQHVEARRRRRPDRLVGRRPARQDLGQGRAVGPPPPQQRPRRIAGRVAVDAERPVSAARQADRQRRRGGRLRRTAFEIRQGDPSHGQAPFP